MIIIHTTPDDLVKMRFAYRPLLEIPLSYRVLRNLDFQSLHRRWVEEAFHATHDVDLPYLDNLVPPSGYIPDFLTPPPTTKNVDIEADFKELLATPNKVIRQGISDLIMEEGNSAIRQHFLTSPREALACLVDEMRIYWQRTLVHYWSRMKSALEGDVLYRARILALDGPSSLFEGLHETIGVKDNNIQIKPVCMHQDNDIELNLRGEGIQVVPVIFRGCGRMFQIAPGWRSMLAYGVRGTGLWCEKPPSSNHALEFALGTSRARVLRTLKTPSSNREVAHKAQIAASTATQHLMRLMKAGLVEPRRSGKRVYYYLTKRGEHLITLFETTD